MRSNSRKFRSGVTLVELVIAISIAIILVLGVGILLASGHRAWQQTYDSAHKQIKEDAHTVAVAFGSVGRKANRLNYKLYDISGSTFIPVVPQTSEPEEVVSGDAVEFRYWDVELDTTDTYNLMDVTKTATAYVLFYIEGGQLKVDYGPYPPGAVPAGGGLRNTSNITTIVLAENVSPASADGAFNHVTLNGVGRGCVRINIVLTDPEDDDSSRVMTAAVMRNIWPR
jgi:hypothetical protein